MRIVSKGVSDVGRKRDHNEDSYLIDEELSLFVVADGMGGHAGGGTASRIAVETIDSEIRRARARPDQPFNQKGPLPESPVPEILRVAVEKACFNIFHADQGDARLSGMGTTTIALLVHREAAFFAHVGDSRAYLVRRELVQQVSEDHSLVNEQIKAGMITAEEARHSRYKNIITRSVGFEQEVVVDVMGIALEVGDTFVLCSDGMSNLVDEKEILQIGSKVDVSAIPKAFIDLANERGGDDNITVICVRVL
jgi:serine/threonine protein phosphatase PrpC